MTVPNITCDDATLLISDRLDAPLPDTQRVQLEAHLASCTACTAVAADLAKLNSDAAALPLMSPSRDLWSGIEARIDAPVVSLNERRDAQQETARRAPAARWTSRQFAAAAAVLMAVTAGGTWLAATRRAPDASASIASQAAAAPRAELVSVASQKGVSAYEGEIAKLHDIIQTRRADLDSTTVVVLEKNLKLIDQAIADCKAALAADPASAFLAEQLSRSYDTKLELLRSAAMLPSRT